MLVRSGNYQARSSHHNFQMTFTSPCRVPGSGLLRCFLSGAGDEDRARYVDLSESLKAAFHGPDEVHVGAARVPRIVLLLHLSDHHLGGSRS